MAETGIESASTLHGRINTCRKRGLLSEALAQGVASGELTLRALDLLEEEG